MTTFRIRGCRGSISVSGAQHQRHGGNTTCFELIDGEHRIIVDAGSGIAPIGREAPWDGRDTLMFFTHYHSDHIVGFPHFLPLFAPTTKLNVVGVERDGQTVESALQNCHRPPWFPLHLPDVIQADITFSGLQPTGSLTHGAFTIRWMELPHPGGASGMRITTESSDVVVMTDCELALGDWPQLVEFAQGADLLLLDAQYTDDEMESRRGWGHSTNTEAARFAVDAGVGELLFVHHDPTRADDAIDQMVQEASLIFPSVGAGYDGWTRELQTSAPAAPKHATGAR